MFVSDFKTTFDLMSLHFCQFGASLVLLFLHKQILVSPLSFLLGVKGGVVKIKEKLGLSSAKLRAQLASPARSIHLCPSLYL